MKRLAPIVLLTVSILLAAPLLFADTIILDDGTRIEGTIVEENDESVVIENEILGRLVLSRSDIREMERPERGEYLRADRSVNSIMFCPTPVTLPKGSFYFRDFELFLLNGGYGLTDKTNLSFGTHFPVTGKLELFTVGLKQVLIDRDRHPIGVALAAGGSFYDEGSFGNVVLITGIGNHDRSLNMAFMHGFSEENESGFVFMTGADARISSNMKIIAEYIDVRSFRTFGGDDFYGLLNIGLKFFADRISFSLTGFRPLTDTGDLFAFPMGSFSYIW